MSNTSLVSEGEEEEDNWDSDDTLLGNVEDLKEKEDEEDSQDEGGFDEKEDGQEQQVKAFKKLARNNRDRHLFQNIHTLELINPHITVEDIKDGARKFLASNTTRSLDVPTAVEVETSEELSNIQRFEGIQNGIMLRKSSTERPPNRPRYLDYVFAQRRVDGRSLNYTITQTTPTTSPELTDLEIALLIHKKPGKIGTTCMDDDQAVPGIPICCISD
jgi:hypothetical protein